MAYNDNTTQQLRFPARRFVVWRLAAALVVTLLALAVLAPAPTSAAPGEVGPDRVYFPQSGHYLAYGFLNYWHDHGGLAIFGYPISEEMTDPASGLTVQYFERAVFEWHPNAAPEWRVQLQRVGAGLTASRQSEAAFRPVTAASDANCTYFAQTGHRLCFGFKDYWQAHGGLAIFGYPISEEFTENGLTVQYFERARFEWHPDLRGTPYEILLGRLGAIAAQQGGVNQTPVSRSADVPVYSPALWSVPTPAQTPPVAPPPGAPTAQAEWIEVDLSGQFLRAWEYSAPVYKTLVSTGVPSHPTPTGYFSIYAKYRYDDMSGGTPGIDYYYLPDVPYVMYFYQAYAIHGTYWHNNFGQVASHGCVNLPTDAAGWIYNWAPIGTTVWIHP